MSNKQIVLELVQKLPEEASLMDIAQEIEFVAGIREADDEIARGEGVRETDVRKLISEWANPFQFAILA